MLAALRGRTEIVKLLLEQKGINVGIKKPHDIQSQPFFLLMKYK